MDRQTVRQRTESDARQRSGKSRRHQGRSRHSRRADFLPAAPPPQRQNSKALTQTSISSSARRRQQFRFASLLLVLGLWSVSLVTAVWATRSLLDPTLSSTNFPVSSDLENPLAPADAVSQPEANAAPPAPIAETIEPESITLPETALNDSYFYQPPEAEHLPIVALGSIALSCAMSCILVSRALHPRRSPPRLEGRSVKRPARPPVKQFPAAGALPAAPLPAAASVKPAIAKESAPAVEIIEVTVPASVTVLPANQSLPLDWDEPSLADSLDLRQHQSLPF